jgi:hypothetical protein
MPAMGPSGIEMKEKEEEKGAPSSPLHIVRGGWPGSRPKYERKAKQNKQASKMGHPRKKRTEKKN